MKAGVISKFWGWFEENSKALQEDQPDDRILAELDTRILSFDRNLSWELGPGIHKEHALTISPSGQRALLPLTQSIIQKAPSVSSWEFYAAKPSKEWTPCFSFMCEAGNELFVDVTNWKYVLAKYEDQTFEMTIWACDSQMLSDEDKLTAAEIAIDGMLGELARIEKISTIATVDALPPELREQSNPLKVLSEHWKSLGLN